MTDKELKSYMLDDIIYDSPDLKFAIYPGIKDNYPYSATTDIYGETNEPTQDFNSFDELMDNFKIGNKALKDILPSLKAVYLV